MTQLSENREITYSNTGVYYSTFYIKNANGFVLYSAQQEDNFY